MPQTKKPFKNQLPIRTTSESLSQPTWLIACNVLLTWEVDLVTGFHTYF